MSKLESFTSITTAIGAIATAILVYIAVQEMQQDHERTRRENAIGLVLEASNAIKPNHFPCLDFVSSISRENTEELFSKRTDVIKLSSDAAVKNVLGICLGKMYKNEFDDKSNILTYKGKAKIANSVNDLLNILEYISSSWRYSIASDEIIYEQFGEIFLSKSLESVISKMKGTRHKKSYPSLNYIVKNKKELIPAPSKSILGEL